MSDASIPEAEAPEELEPADAPVGELSGSRKVVLAGLALLAVALLGGLVWSFVGGDDDDPATAVAGGGTSEIHQLGYQTFDASPADLGRFAGQPLVLNFFASWCGPCVAELPEFEAVSQDVAGDVNFFGLAVRDRPEDALGILAETGVTFDTGQDTEDLLEFFQGVAMPTTVLISAEGEMLHRHLGPLAEPQLRDLIGEHFGVDA